MQIASRSSAEKKIRSNGCSQKANSYVSHAHFQYSVDFLL